MEQVFARDPSAIAVVESALIFEVVRDALARGEKDTVLADWRQRIDRMVVVTAPDETKIARYASRTSAPGPAREAAQADARRRLAHQIPDAQKAALADYVIDNSGDKAALYTQVSSLWQQLKAQSNNSPPNLSLQ
jgi:dephospho-CoA kinase